MANLGVPHYLNLTGISAVRGVGKILRSRGTFNQRVTTQIQGGLDPRPSYDHSTTIQKGRIFNRHVSTVVN